VSIATRYGMGGQGIESRWGEIFCTLSDRPWGPPTPLYDAYRVSFPGVKRPGRGVDHPLPSSAEVKERVELYLPSPTGSSCFLQDELYIYLIFNWSRAPTNRLNAILI
jgi:hypothetical protein